MDIVCLLVTERDIREKKRDDKSWFILSVAGGGGRLGRKYTDIIQTFREGFNKMFLEATFCCLIIIELGMPLS